MYRDEILAIADAVLEAHSKGESKANQAHFPRVNDLEHAVRVLYRYVKEASKLEAELIAISVEAGDLAAHWEEFRERLASANQKMLKLRKDAMQALSESRVQYLRPRIPDGEDVPF